MKTFLLHTGVLLGVIILTCLPALWFAVLWAESGMLGYCMEGSCGYTALFLLFPLFWIGLTVIGFLLWLWLRRRHQRKVAARNSL